MRTLFLLFLATAAFAQHPRLILDTARVAEMRGKITAADWTWSDATYGLKAKCDAYVPETVWPMRSLDERYNGATAASRYSTVSIQSQYEGIGYFYAVSALGLCYQANLIDNPSAAATYGAQLLAVANVLAVAPGKALSARTISSVDKGTATTFHYSGSQLGYGDSIEISGASGSWAALNGAWNVSNVTAGTFQLLFNTSAYSGSFDGVVNKASYIADSSWLAGTAWKAGITANGAQNNEHSISLTGMTAGGTVVAGDAFVVTHGAAKYSLIVSASTTADGSGNATIALCGGACIVNQGTGAFISGAYPSGGLTNGDAISREIVLLSGGSTIVTGDTEVISGVTGNVAANGTFTVTTIDGDHFLLQGSTAGAVAQTNLMWDPGVNQGYSARYFPEAIGFAYDWGYSLLSSGQRAAMRAHLTAWRVSALKVNAVAIDGNSLGHPMGNYWEGMVAGMLIAALAQEPEDAFQTAAYTALRTMFWDKVGAYNGDNWVPSGISDYYSTYATDWYYGDGPFYGNDGLLFVLETLFSMKTAKSYDPASDAHPFTWAPGQFYLHTTLANRMTGGLRTSMNDSGMGSGTVAGRDAHRWNAGSQAILQAYLRSTGDTFAPYVTSWLADYYAAAKTLGVGQPVNPWTTREIAFTFLFYLDTATSTDYKTLATNYASTKQPELLWRKDWTTTADWFSFNSSARVNDISSSKYSLDAGALYIARAGGNLLTNPINEYFKYSQTAMSYEVSGPGVLPRFANVFQVGYPGYPGYTYPYLQTSYGPAYGPAYDPVANNCNGVRATLASDVTSTYVYARSGGLEKMYPSFDMGNSCASKAGAVTQWTRKVVQVKNANQTTFAHDITNIYSSAWDQMMVWSFGGQGSEVSAPSGMHRYDIGPGGPLAAYIGTAYSIYPASHTTKYGDPRDAGVFTVAVSSGLQPNATSRLEIRPAGAPAATTWLSMFDLAATAAAAYVPTALTSTHSDAVQVNDDHKSVVVFPTADTPVLPITYTFATGGTVNHYVAGMVAATGYLVNRDGVAAVVNSDAGGMLTFPTTGSNTSITISSSAYAALAITSTSPLGVATKGVAYTSTLAASGGDTVYTWSLYSGTLPLGLTLSSGGVISGTPSYAGAGGVSTFTVSVASGDGQSANGTFTITVGASALVTFPRGFTAPR